MTKVLKKYRLVNDSSEENTLYHSGIKQMVVRDDVNGTPISDFPKGLFYELDSEEANKFIVNDDVEIPSDDYRQHRIFKLYSNVKDSDFNDLGDVVHLVWHVNNPNGIVAVEESRVYKRTEIYVNNLPISQIQKTTTIKFFKHNGEFKTIILNKFYNLKEIKVRDTKARRNLVEQAREYISVLLLQLMQQNNWTIAQLLEQVAVAKQTIFDLDKELNVYTEHRESKYLILGLREKLALDNYVLDKSILNYLINKLNVKFYPSDTLY